MMDVIKRKILLETLTDRSNSSTYGTITADTIDINIFLTQNIDDMGMFTDMEFIPDENGKTVEDYYSTGGIITGTTNSKLISLKTYKRNK